MPGGRAVVLVRIDEVPPDIEAEWNRWYDDSHIPARLALPGFIEARRFRGYEGEAGYLTLYELENAAAAASETYRELKRKELLRPADSFEARTLKLPGFQRGVYRQVYPDRAYEVPDTEYLFLVAHDIPAEREEAYTAWYDTEHIPAMLRVPGFITARRFKRSEPLMPESGARPSSPQYLTLYDLADGGAVESEQFLRDRNSPWTSWVRSWYTRRLRIKARRISRICARPHHAAAPRAAEMTVRR